MSDFQSMKPKTPFLQWLLCLWCLVLFAIPAQAGTKPSIEPSISVGSINGQFLVDATGAAVYTIPIRVPPGTGDLGPTLAIQYRSAKGNGILGMGWTLSGIPSISRCPKTLAQDGVHGRVEFNDNDRFALDGQRLMALPGQYGKPKTVYHTERETWVKVVSGPVTCGSGPCSFEVWKKDGTKLEFGTLADSRIKAEGRQEILVWALSRVTDPNGNYMQFSYQPGSQVLLPSRIDYTGNDGPEKLPFNRRVLFFYQDRPDKRRKFANGLAFTNTKRLSSIRTEISAGSGGYELVKKYDFVYTTSGTSSRSLLSRIQESDNNGVHLPATRIDWQKGGTPGTFESAAGSRSSGGSGRYLKKMFTVDVDGDGKTDMVRAWNNGGKLAFSTYFSDGKHFSSPLINRTRQRADYVSLLPGDVDGDGRSDFVLILKDSAHKQTLYTYLSAGKAGYSRTPNKGSAGDPKTVASYLLLDVNGDGRIDFVQVRNKVNKLSLQTYFSDGKGYSGPPVDNDTGKFSQTIGVFPADINGDGLCDIIQATDNDGLLSLCVFFSDGKGFSNARISQATQLDAKPKAMFPADCNGDGLLDIVLAREKNDRLSFDVCFYNGSGFEVRSNIGTNQNPDFVSLFPADANRDGMADIVQIRNKAGKLEVLTYLSKGIGFQSPARAVLGDPQATIRGGIFSADPNGDGLADLVQTRNRDNQLDFITYTASGPWSDLAGTITNGLGGSVKIDYKPLTSADVYQRGQGAVYPQRDYQSALQVVARHRLDDGNGHSFEFNHFYESSKLDLHGRGWLGFGKTRLTESNGNQTIIYNNLEFPLQGHPAKTEWLDASEKLLGRKTFTYIQNQPEPGLGTHSVLLSRQKFEHFTAGKLDYTLASEFQYDRYGNPTLVSDLGDIKTTKDDVFHKMTYDNYKKNWHLGLLKSKRSATSAAGFGQKWIPGQDLSWQRFKYDPKGKGNLIMTERWLDESEEWIQTRLNYDGFGNIIATTDAEKNTSTIAYETQFYRYPRLRATPPNQAGHRLSSTEKHDPAFGRKLSQTGPNGQTRRVQVDGFGRVVAVLGPDLAGRESKLSTIALKKQNFGYSRTTYHRTSWAKEPGNNGFWTKSVFDGLGRGYQSLTRGIDPNTPILREIGWNAQDRIDKKSLPFLQGDTPKNVTYSYDSANRPVKVTYPNGAKAETNYRMDQWKITTSTPDPSDVASGHRLVESERITDSRGRTIQKVKPDGSKTQFEYDRLGRLLSSTDTNGGKTVYRYDSLGRMRSKTSPDSGKWTYDYDKNGRPIRIADAKGQQTRWNYDALGRQTKKTRIRSDGKIEEQLNFTYDDPKIKNGKGRLTQVELPGIYTASFSYDGAGNLAASNMNLDNLAFAFKYTYDAMARPLSTNYPDGSVLKYKYAANGLLDSIALKEKSGKLQTLASYQDYNAAGAFQKISYGNGIVTQRAFGIMGALQSAITKNQGTTFLDYEYSWNKAGRLLTISDKAAPKQSQEFTYNERGFLLAASGGYPHKSYSYDQSGNFRENSSISYQYEDSASKNRLTSVKADGAKAALNYDPNGNVVDRGLLPSLETQSEKDGGWLYRFNAGNRLTGVRRGKTDEYTFVYDGLGSRLKTVDSRGTVTTKDDITTLYISADYEITRYPTGDVITRYVHGPSGLVASFTRKSSPGGLGSHFGDAQRIRAGMYDISTLDGFLQYAGRNLSWLFSHPLTKRLTALLLVLTLPILVSILYLLVFLRRAPEKSFGGRVRRVSAFLITRGLGLSPAWEKAHVQRQFASPQQRGPAFRFMQPVALMLLILVQGGGTPLLADLGPGPNGPGYPTAGVRYYHQDQIFSTAVVSNEKGLEVSRVSYEPYGRIDQPGSSGRDDFRAKFTGKERDASSGLYYFGARYYDPLIGRFISPDPANQYDSPYIYVGGHPADTIDPNGEFAITTNMILGTLGVYWASAVANNSMNPLKWNWTSGKTWRGIGLSTLMAVVTVASVATGTEEVVFPAVAEEALASGSANSIGTVLGGVENSALTLADKGSTDVLETFRTDMVSYDSGEGLGALKEKFGILRSTDNAVQRLQGESSALASYSRDMGESSELPVTGCTPGASLAEGTRVQCEKGEKPIEDVEVGDRLWSYDEASKEPKLCRVKRLFTRIATGMVLLTLASGETVAATSEHPFLVTDRGWEEAGALKPGDELATLSGLDVQVTSVKSVDTQVRVFNIEVEDTHNYYISPLKILNHNPPPCTTIARVVQSIRALGLQRVSKNYSSDIWFDTTIKKGTILTQLSPGGGGFYALQDVEENLDSIGFHEKYQVLFDLNRPRNRIKLFVAKTDMRVAISKTLANRIFGSGEGTQVYTDDFGNLGSHGMKLLNF